MNICIINSDYSIGGQQKVSAMLGSELNKTDNVFIYSFFPKKIFFKEYKNLITVDTTNIDIDIYSKIKRKIGRKILNKRNDLSYVNRINTFCEFLKRNNIEVLVVNGGLLTSFVPLIKLKIPELKVVSWQHNTAEIYLEKYYVTIIDEYLEGLKQSDVVVCLTEHDKEIFSNYCTKVISIKNPVDINDNLNYISELDNKQIVFASRYSIESKGIDLLCQLVSELPEDYSVVFAGSGTKKERKQVEKLIHENNIETRIRLLGNLNKNELSKYYIESSAFISTSRWEGFGLGIVEAMSYGLPIISFNNEGPREILSDGKNGLLIEKFDLNDFKGKILWLMEDQSRMKELQLRSLKRASDYSPNKIAAIWRTVLSDLINEKGVEK